MKQLSASKERLLKNAVILAAQSFVFQALTKQYSLGHQLFKFCTKIGSGSTPKGGKAVYVPDGIPFIRSLNVRQYEFQEENLARIPPEINEAMSGTCVLPGDVYLNITGASIGRSCCAPEELCPANVSQHVCIIRPIRELLDSRFLMYWLNDSATQEEINTIQKGATREALTKRQIENFRLPAVPICEQKEVAAFLEAVRLGKDYREIKLPLHLQHITPAIVRIEELAAKVGEARGLRRQSAEEAEALTWAGSTQLLKAISPDGILAHVLNEKPRNGWSAPCNNMPEGIPVLSLGAITGFRYRETEFKRTSECVFDNAHYWLHPGDLLMTRSNTYELVGHAAIYNGYPSPCIYPDLMMRLDVNESKADKYFVLHWLSCVLVRDYIKAKAKGTSPTMKKITQDVVMNVPFPSNLPLSEQRRIVAYLDDLQAKVDTLKRFQAETAAELDALLPSILDKGFKGEL